MATAVRPKGKPKSRVVRSGKGMAPARKSTKIRPIAVLGPTQRAVLDALTKRKTGATAVAIRDAIGKADAEHEGTRATHAVLKRLCAAGLVERSGANGDARNKTGSIVMFSITNTGRDKRKER